MSEVKKIVVVKFKDTVKSYSFKNDIAGLEEGDKVVVDTARGLQVAEVLGFKDVCKSATKYIVQKIDLDAHQKRLEKEEKARAIRAKLEKRRKELEELELYEMLAAKDENMAELLKEYKELT